MRNRIVVMIRVLKCEYSPALTKSMYIQQQQGSGLELAVCAGAASQHCYSNGGKSCKCEKDLKLFKTTKPDSA